MNVSSHSNRMAWATPTDYRHAIQDPVNVLADEELRQATRAGCL